jgi:hypothetical protein
MNSGRAIVLAVPDKSDPAQEKGRIEAAIAARNAAVYANFLLPHLRPDMLYSTADAGKRRSRLGWPRRCQRVRLSVLTQTKKVSSRATVTLPS